MADERIDWVAARQTHPDVGGDADAFRRLTEAYVAAKEVTG